MRNFGKRAWLLLGLGLLAVPLAAVGLANACTGLATISSNPGSGPAGAVVTVNGKGFAPHDPSDARTAPAEIRLDNQSGPVLGTASPAGGAAGGSFSVQITIPQVPSGDHVLIATQTGTDGRPAYGTPARQVFTVTDPPAPAAQPAPAAPVASATAQPTPRPSAGGGSGAKAPDNSAALAKALAACNKKYSSKKAKSKSGKTRMSKKRAACRSKARTRFS